MIEMTRDPLPSGERDVTLGLGSCPTCGSSEYVIGRDVEVRMTRSVERQADGKWLAYVHHDWCPAWTGIVPELPCPVCGSPVEGVETNSVGLYRVPGVRGLVEGNEANERRHGWGWRLAGSHVSTVGLGPCGHVLERARCDDVDGFLSAAGTVHARRVQDQTDALLEHHADLLDAARVAGAEPLVAAYEEAVRHGSKTVAGLLEALRVQAAVPCRCDETVAVVQFGGNVVRRISQCTRHRPDPTPGELLAAADRMAADRSADLIREAGPSDSGA